MSRNKEKQPTVPAAVTDTVRQRIIGLLAGRSLSSQEISAEAGISEREVEAHLEHIRRSAHGFGVKLRVTAAECRKCGFIFHKRERLSRPGKCPVCRGQSISQPHFTLELNR